jgi:hypothetical protein
VFGHKHEHGREWTPAAGIVVESHKHHRDWTYVVEYRRPTGHAFRVTIPAFDGHNVELPPGTQVQIEFDAQSDEVRLTAPPASAGAPSVREAVRLAREMHGQGGAAVAAALAGLGQTGLGQSGDGVRVVTSSEVHVVGGPEVRVVGGAQAAEVMEAVQQLMSGRGDPAAARERMRHLKEELIAQNGTPGPAGQTAFSSPEPSTFDSVAETPASIAPTTFSSPDPSVGQPGPSFGQPGFSPAAPATTFSSPANPGSFNAGSAFNSGVPAGAGGSFASGSFGDFGATKSDRIARLEDQRDRGQITPEQFAAQRQQIQDEI